MEITLYAESIDDITASSSSSIAVELSGVDLSALIMEVGAEELLAEIGTEKIEEYLKIIDEDENGETL